MNWAFEVLLADTSPAILTKCTAEQVGSLCEFTLADLEEEGSQSLMAFPEEFLGLELTGNELDEWEELASARLVPCCASGPDLLALES